MSEEPIIAVSANLEQGKPFEVRYENGIPVVSDVKGISKISLSPDEVKNAKIKKTAKRKVAREQKTFLLAASETLLQNRVPFKIIFGTEESTLRFDLDHYIRLSRNKEEKVLEKCLVLGFNSLDEMPVVLIQDLLSTYPNVKLLIPKR